MLDDKNKTGAHYIHRISYSAQERLAGTFVLIAVALLAWLLITSQKSKTLFEEEITLYGTMSSIQAVDKDTNVIISGLNIGSVTDVIIDDANNVVISMSILKKYQKLIRTDSVAELLNFKFALLGKSVIEISVGSPQLPVIKDGSTLVIKESLNLIKLLAKFEPVIVSLQDSIQKFNQILNAIEPQQITSNIRNVESITSSLKTISKQVKSGKGSVGAAFFDQNLQQDLLSSTASLKAITAQIQQGKGTTGKIIFDENLQQDMLTSIANLRAVTEKTLTLLDAVQQQVDEIPELTDKVKPLLDEADKTIRATQQIWPLSNAIPKDSKQSLASPEATD